jgi:predicted negative regulator of RcsB-dependent stress response
MQYASQLQQATILMGEQNFDRAEIVLKELLENKKTPKKIKTISGMQLGALMLEQNKDDEALKAYKYVEKTTGDQFMREVAQLIQLNTLIKQNDEKNDPEINALLKKLDTKDTILHFLALEQKAIYKLNKGMKDEANKSYEDAKLLEATQSSKFRIYEIYESHESKK